MGDSDRIYVFRPRIKPPHPLSLDSVPSHPITAYRSSEKLAAGSPIVREARLQKAAGSTWQPSASAAACAANRLEANQACSPIFKTDFQILNDFFEEHPTGKESSAKTGLCKSASAEYAQQRCDTVRLELPFAQQDMYLSPLAPAGYQPQETKSNGQSERARGHASMVRRSQISQSAAQPPSDDDWMLAHAASPCNSTKANTQAREIHTQPCSRSRHPQTMATDTQLAAAHDHSSLVQSKDVTAHTKWLKSSAYVSAKQAHRSIVPVDRLLDSNNAIDMSAAMTTGYKTPVVSKSPGRAIPGDQPPPVQSRKCKAPRSSGTQSSSDQQQASSTQQPQQLQRPSLHQNAQGNVFEKDTAAVLGLHDKVPSKLSAEASTQCIKKRRKLIQPVLQFGALHAQPPSQNQIKSTGAESTLKANGVKTTKQKVKAEEPQPSECQRYCDGFIEIATEAELKLCHQAVEASAICCLGLLMKAANSHFSTLRPLPRSQVTSVHKPTGKGAHGSDTKEPAAANVQQTSKGIVQDSHKVVGLALLPVPPPQVTIPCPTTAFPHAQQPVSSAQADTSLVTGKQHLAEPRTQSASDHLSNSPLWVLPMALLDESPGAADDKPPSPGQCRALLISAMTRNTSTVCFNMQDTLSKLLKHGCQLPDASEIRLTDPRLLAWLHEPQLLQRDEKEIEGYTLQVLASRYQLPPAAALPEQPLQQLRADMQQALQLAADLEPCIMPYMPKKTVQTEMQVAAVLAHMETVGMGFNAEHLLHHERCLRSRSAAIEQQAAQLVGTRINLSSASQLAVALYDTLALPAPGNRSDRGSAKAHHTTDEAALKQLSALHPLPGLVLGYRCMQNILNKWIEPQWVKQTAAASIGGQKVRVRCSWNQTATATGRLSSSSPNLQAVTKYTLGAKADVSITQDLSQKEINIRDGFVASSGCVLIGADYSQIELRVLAHLSGDTRLISILTQAGVKGDAFALIARTWLRKPQHAGTPVTSEEREKAKTVTYGIVYGLSAWGLAKGPAGLGIDIGQAQNLISSFLDHFQGVKQFVHRTKEEARVNGYITTLSGRRRPIKALPGKGFSLHQAGAEADRKAVNSTIQGSAADLIKSAMCAWGEWQHAHPGMGKAARLVAQIHDELLFEVNTQLCDVYVVAGAVQQLMEGVVQFRVPLTVNVSCGQLWGKMTRM